MDNFKLYKDIKARTDGEIYIGVVGPVRTGKSTFIKRFMDLMILPAIENTNEKERIIDEMPQAAAGRTVMTTEPKFIPKDAININVENNISAKFRLIDCVGYMVSGAGGIYEDGKERLVKTPWYDKEIPFTKAAEYGTGKVIKDHSTIGIVVTSDGSIGEIPRENFLEAEEKTIKELKAIKKPFVVVVNSTHPDSKETKQTATAMEEKYNVPAIATDCENLNKDDINRILLKILYEFPVAQIEFYLPKWAEMLSVESPIKTELIECAKKITDKITCIKDVVPDMDTGELTYISKIKYESFDFVNGVEKINFEIDEKYYYVNLSELTGEPIEDEYELISMLKSLSHIKKEYGRYLDAVRTSIDKGYGVVLPDKSEIELSEPQVIKTGNKYGVKIKAQSPSVHMIKVSIGTEISPIVGSQQQAMDLMNYITDSKKQGEIWETNIFGKSIGQLVEDGIRSKIMMLSDDSQIKLQETMQKVVNENSGGLVCLII